MFKSSNNIPNCSYSNAELYLSQATQRRQPSIGVRQLETSTEPTLADVQDEVSKCCPVEQSREKRDASKTICANTAFWQPMIRLELIRNCSIKHCIKQRQEFGPWKLKCDMHRARTETNESTRETDSDPTTALMHERETFVTQSFVNRSKYHVQCGSDRAKFCNELS